MEATTVYFERPGQENTAEVFRAVKRRAAELGIRTVLVASTRGDTAVKAVAALDGLRLVVVTHSPEISRRLGRSLVLADGCVVSLGTLTDPLLPA